MGMPGLSEHRQSVCDVGRSEAVSASRRERLRRHHETSDQCALYQETASRAEEQIRKPEGGLAQIWFGVRFVWKTGLSGKCAPGRAGLACGLSDLFLADRRPKAERFRLLNKVPAEWDSEELYLTG